MTYSRAYSDGYTVLVAQHSKGGWGYYIIRSSHSSNPTARCRFYDTPRAAKIAATRAATRDLLLSPKGRWVTHATHYKDMP